MKLLGFLIICITLSGCNQYSAVGTKPVAVGSMTVRPESAWNAVPRQEQLFGAPTWTRNGRSLDSVSFIFGIREGEPIVMGLSSTEKGELPAFEEGMLPDEIVELFETTALKIYQTQIIEKGVLRPISLAVGPAFEYEFVATAPDQVIRRSRLYGIVKEDKLYLVFYQAARMHYFDASESDIERIVKTISES